MFAFKSDKKEEFKVSHCYEQCAKQKEFGKHLHESYELLLFISGDVTFNIDGQSYPLLPYDLVFVPPLSYHFITLQSNAVYENYVINFDRNLVKESRLDKLFIPPYVKNISNADKLRRMFANFDFYYKTYSSEDFEEASKNLLNEILILSCYASFDKKDLHISSEKSIIPDIISYISKNIECELNADILAKELRFSKSHIKNYFSSTMGIGIQQYINRKKIYAAHIDILSGMEITRVAEKYGYKDYSSFYRQYLSIIGVSPAQTKKETT